jgi:hypothetical protein
VARSIVRLKLLLYRRSASTPSEVLALVGFAIGGLLVGIGTHHALAVLRDAPGGGRALAAAIFTSMAGAWMLIAVTTAGAGVLLPPRALDGLPLTRRTRAIGFGFAALVGILPAATIVGLAGVLWSVSDLLAVAPVLVAVGAQLALCAFLSLLAGSAVSSTGARRSRDLAVALSSVFGVVGLLAYHSLGSALTDPEHLAPSRLTSVLAWLPPGALGRAVAEAAAGHLLRATVLDLYGVAAAAAVAVTWIWTLDREVGGGAGRARRTTASGLGLIPRVLRALPTNAVTGTAAAELRQTGRDPRRLTSAISFMVVGIVMVWPATRRHPELWPYVPVGGLAWLLSNQTGTLLAYDGDALWSMLLASRSWPVLLGKQLALAVLALPVLAVSILGVAAWRSAAGDVAPALLLGIAVYATWMGIGSIEASHLVFAIPRDPQRTSRPKGPGALAIVYVGVGMAACAALAAAVLVAPAGARVAVAAATALVGAASWAAGLRVGAHRLDARAPEVLAAMAAT